MDKAFVILILGLSLTSPSKGVFRKQELNKKNIPIGAIFQSNTVEEVAFKAALDRASMFSEHFNYQPVISYAPYGDSFASVKAACDLTAEGVLAIFGPGEARAAAAVNSRCRAVHVPNFQTSWHPPPQRNTLPTLPPALNLFPDSESLAVALAALVEDYDWKSYTVLYDEDHGLIRLQEVIKRTRQDGRGGSAARIRRLNPGGDNRSLFKALYEYGETHIILDCPADRVIGYLMQAHEVNFFEDYQSYILTSLDVHTLDFENRFGAANVTCLRLLDTTDPDVRIQLAEWRHRAEENVALPSQPEQITVSQALAHDAAWTIAQAIESSRDQISLEPTSLPCSIEVGEPWQPGEEFISHILTNPVSGLTGRIEFTENGRRSQFKLDVMELSKNGFNKIASWSHDEGMSYSRSEDETSELLNEKLQNKVFRVVSRLGAPYLVQKTPKEGEELFGNARYEGYSMDLIDRIAKVLNFSYVFELVPDGKYGSFNKETKKWDGLVKHLLDRKADLAICDLTITFERRSAVDFTMPFMTLGISILYAKPYKQDPELFSFLKPLSVDVWIYMATAYLIVSLLLHVLARFAPSDWENPHPCNKDPEELENIWDIKNSCWLTVGSLMTQGCDLLPKGISTRWICGMWWFFTLIMCSSYTANLAAFLTNERMDDTIAGAEDLAKQTKVKYGAVAGGSTASFFKTSNFSTYQRMWASMESTRPSVFCKNNDEGVDRVLKGKRQYAFLMESTGIEYVVERNCELMQVGGLLDSKGYGIAMPVNSPYRTAISGAVLKLAELGVLVELKTKWWKDQSGAGCEEDEEGGDADAAELGVDNVGGVFVVLGLGCGAAAALAAIEFLWNVRAVAVEQKMSQSEALLAELIFALSFWETEKPVKHSRSSSPASESGQGSRAQSVLKAATSLFKMDTFFENDKN